MDLARGQRLAGLHQFVARGEDAHAQRTEYVDGGVTQRGCYSQCDGRECTAGGQGNGTLLQVFTATTDILASMLARRDDDPCLCRFADFDDLHALLHDDGVGTRGHGCTGHDALGVAGGQGGRRIACQGAAGHGQLRGRIGGQVRSAYGITVHGGAVVRGQVQGGDQVGGQYPAVSGRQQDGFMPDGGGHPADQVFACLRHGQGFGVRRRFAVEQGVQGAQWGGMQGGVGHGETLL